LKCSDEIRKSREHEEVSVLAPRMRARVIPRATYVIETAVKALNSEFGADLSRSTCGLSALKSFSLGWFVSFCCTALCQYIIGMKRV
jgi:hypothetical protein